MCELGPSDGVEFAKSVGSASGLDILVEDSHAVLAIEVRDKFAAFIHLEWLPRHYSQSQIIVLLTEMCIHEN